MSCPTSLSTHTLLQLVKELAALGICVEHYLLMAMYARFKQGNAAANEQYRQICDWLNSLCDYLKKSSVAAIQPLTQKFIPGFRSFVKRSDIEADISVFAKRHESEIMENLICDIRIRLEDNPHSFDQWNRMAFGATAWSVLLTSAEKQDPAFWNKYGSGEETTPDSSSSTKEM